MHDAHPVMAVDRISPPVHPLPSAPGATAALRATQGVAPIDDPVERAALVAEAPDTALEAVQVAAKAYEELKRSGRELRFGESDGIIRIDVFDGSGRLVRTIPPNEVLALASREAQWRA